MGSFPKCDSSFFKVMFGDFTSKIKIPPLFVKNYEGKFSKRCCILKIDEKSWRIKLEHDKNDYFFQDGWRKFVTDNHIEMGEFLVFYLVDMSTFHVQLYGRSCCTKTFKSAHFESVEPTLVNIEETESEEEEDVVEIDSFPTKTEHPHCEIVFKNYHRYFLNVPKKFATEIGISRRGKIILKDPEGRKWPVEVYLDARGFKIGGGWSSFRKANKLEEGDKCLLQFIGALIEVRFLRKERGGGSHRSS